MQNITLLCSPSIFTSFFELLNKNYFFSTFLSEHFKTIYIDKLRWYSHWYRFRELSGYRLLAIFYLTTRIRALVILSIADRIESAYSNCFSRNLWWRNKKTMLFFDKQLLNLFKQPMVMIHQRLFVEWNCQIDTSNYIFLTFEIF